MANFKVGQRVRVARWDNTVSPEYRGVEVIFDGGIGLKSFFAPRLADCWVLHQGKRFYAYTGYLDPLIDPKADQFIERIKKLKPYEEPTVKPLTVA